MIFKKSPKLQIISFLVVTLALIYSSFWVVDFIQMYPKRIEGQVNLGFGKGEGGKFALIRDGLFNYRWETNNNILLHATRVHLPDENGIVREYTYFTSPSQGDFIILRHDKSDDNGIFIEQPISPNISAYYLGKDQNYTRVTVWSRAFPQPLFRN